MRRVLLLVFIMAGAAMAKTAIDLMAEGRFTEARAILDTTQASPRYQLLLYAMTETDAQRACSLYTAITARYPGTDCDSVARERLDLARQMGFTGTQPVAATQPAELIAGRSDNKSGEVILSDARASQAATPKAGVESKPRVETPKTEPVAVAPSTERTKIASTVDAASSAAAKPPVQTVTSPEPKAAAKPEVKSETKTASTPLVADAAPVSPKAAAKPAVATPTPPVVETPKVEKPAAKSPPNVETKIDVPAIAGAKATEPIKPPKVTAPTSVANTPTTSEVTKAAGPATKAEAPTTATKTNATDQSKPVPPVPPKPTSKQKQDQTGSVERKPESPGANAGSVAPAKPVAGETPTATEPAKTAPPSATKPAPAQTKPVAQPATESNSEPATKPLPMPKENPKPAQPTPAKVAPGEEKSPPPSKSVTAEAERTGEIKPASASSERSAVHSSAKSGGWFIQVGAFGNPDNAHRLAQKLESAGYGVKLVPRVQGDKELLQVRVGGYASRDECVPEVDKLKSQFSVPAVIITE